MINEMNGKKLFSKFLLISLIGFLFSLIPFASAFTQGVCGQTITGDTTLTTDLLNCAGTGITIGANNVVIDCAGHTISYSNSQAGYGVNVSGFNNTKIKNCVITKTSESCNSYGIYFSNSKNGLIDNNNITIHSGACGNHGIRFSSSSNNTLVNNRIITYSVSMDLGIRFDNSNNNNINNNEIINSGNDASGIQLSSSSGNNFTNNNITTSGTNSPGIYLYSSSNNVITSNNIIPFIYSTDNSPGILLQSNSNNNLMRKNNINCPEDCFGININGGDNNIIDGNSMTTPGAGHIEMIIASGGVNHSIINNYLYGVTGSWGYGLYSVKSSNIINNTIIISGASSEGIYIAPADTNNNITQNTITGSEIGIRVNLYNNNKIFNNNIYGNTQDVYIDSCPTGDLALLLGGGNYWGHSTPPLLLAEDINCLGMADSLAYDDLNAWPSGAMCSDYSSQGSCEAVDGCYWSAVGPCGCMDCSVYDEQSCSNFPNCFWDSQTAECLGIRELGWSDGITCSSWANYPQANCDINNQYFACRGTLPSAPPECGNSIKEGDEVCDLNSQACMINGYTGMQSCNSSCTGWNSCVATQSCGDNIKNGLETCDGTDLNGMTCNDIIPTFIGELACEQDCSDYDIIDCHIGAGQDTDFDTIEDSSDNCVDDYNPDQRDIDADSAGDVCDVCPSDADNLCDSDYTATEVISTAGGTLANLDNEIVLEFPANAVGEDVSISMTKTTIGPNFIISTLWGEIYEAFYQYVIGPKNYQFNDYYTLKMKYDPNSYSPYDLTIFWFNEETQSWEDQAANGAFCPDSGDDYGYCLVQLNHFSKYALVKKITGMAVQEEISSQGEAASLETNLVTEKAAGGFEFEVKYNDSALDFNGIDLTQRGEDITCTSTVLSDGTLKISCLGLGEIPDFSGDIIKLDFDVSPTAPEGFYDIQTQNLIVGDVAGNQIPTNNFDGAIIVDTTAPAGRLSVNENWVKNNYYVSLSCSDELSGCDESKQYYGLSDDPNCVADIQYSQDILAESHKFMCWKVYDRSGNYAEGISEIKIDKIAPLTTDNAPTGWQTSDVTITLSASDSESGIMETIYCINDACKLYENPIEFTEQGLYTLKYYSVDNAGNVETEKSAIIQIDKEAPEIFIEETGTMGENNWFVSIVNWIARAYDSVSGIKSLNYTITRIP